MLTFFEHLRERHPAMATYIFGGSIAVIIISLVMLIYFLRQDRVKKEQRREQRRE